jgi:uncharacterized membrane protein
MYFFDPQRGKKRRARVEELATHAQHVERVLFGKAMRDAAHRAHGLAERMKHPLGSEVSDGVLQSRVRAALGRACSSPRQIEVGVRDGWVTLRGAVAANEIDAVIACAEKIAGVHGVDDRLELRPADRPPLQRKREMWPPAIQVGAIGAGGALAAWGLLLKRGLVGLGLGAFGGALLLRGVINRPFARVFRRGDIVVQKTITVHAPIARVFDVWSRLDNFPRFMEHVRAVIVDGKRSLWRVDGPGGKVVQFESEITKLEPDRVIEWRTLPDQIFHHLGRVKFEEVADGTRVHVQLTYRPPVGMLGHAVAHILGFDPKTRMNEDLIRMKTLIEDGHTRAHGERVTLEDLH